MNLDKKYEDGDLVAQLRQKDHQAFTRLYDRYAPALYSVVLQIVDDKETANKVILEVFTQIWRNIETYRPDFERLFTWMLKIGRAAAIEEAKNGFHLKAKERLPVTRNEMLDLIARSDKQDCGLKKLMHRLKEDQLMLVDLCYFKDFNHDQIARLLEIPSETVESRLKMALSELRTMFS